MRIAVAKTGLGPALVGLSLALSAAASAQTGYTQPYGATMPGPATAPTGPSGVGAPTAPPRPPYQSGIGLPYGPGNPAPYAYGGGLPGVGDPTKRPGRPSAVPTTGAPTAGAAPTGPVRPPGGQPTAVAPNAVVPGAAVTGDGAAQGEGEILDATTGTAGVAPPLDPRLGGPVRNYSGPGNNQPLIKAAPDFKTGDPYARSAGSPALPAPIGTSPFTRPYTVDSQGNYYNSTGTYVGKVDNKGVVRDRYGNMRGTVQR